MAKRSTTGQAAKQQRRSPARQGGGSSSGAGPHRGGGARSGQMQPKTGPRLSVRLLPVIAVVALLALGLRLGDVWESLLAAGDQAIAETQAAQDRSRADTAADGDAGTTPSPSEQDDQPRLETTSGGEGVDLVEEVSAESSGTQLAQAEGEDGTGSGDSASDPLSEQDFRGLEGELRQKLEQRRQALEQRAAKLDQREATLQAVEQRVDEKIQELESLRNEIQNLVDEYKARNEERLQNLVNIYRRMEPEQAAAIFEDLDMEVMVQVVQNMRDRDAAPIIGQMNPQRARELTARMAQSKDLPDVSEATDGGNEDTGQ